MYTSPPNRQQNEKHNQIPDDIYTGGARLSNFGKNRYDTKRSICPKQPPCFLNMKMPAMAVVMGVSTSERSLLRHVPLTPPGPTRCVYRENLITGNAIARPSSIFDPPAQADLFLPYMGSSTVFVISLALHETCRAQKKIESWFFEGETATLWYLWVSVSDLGSSTSSPDVLLCRCYSSI